MTTSEMYPRALRVGKKSVVSGSKNKTKGNPVIAARTANQNSNTKAIIDHGHNLASKPLTLSLRFARHQVNGLLIWVATALATIPRNIGGEPPPTRKSKIDRNSRIGAPYFL